MRDLPDEIGLVAGLSVPAEIDLRRCGDPPRQVAAPRRISAEFGWRRCRRGRDVSVGSAWRWQHRAAA